MTYSLTKTTFRFKEGVVYSGDHAYGGCGFMKNNMVTIIRRTKNFIYYKDSWGKILKARREYHIKCEFFSNETESFYADSIEPQGVSPNVNFLGA